MSSAKRPNRWFRTTVRAWKYCGRRPEASRSRRNGPPPMNARLSHGSRPRIRRCSRAQLPTMRSKGKIDQADPVTTNRVISVRGRRNFPYPRAVLKSILKIWPILWANSKVDKKSMSGRPQGTSKTPYRFHLWFLLFFFFFFFFLNIHTYNLCNNKTFKKFRLTFINLSIFLKEFSQNFFKIFPE